ncbi:MAG: hypothetical protein CML68_14280 [Rhodobacteraceae bacterium]|nr:hypothetical protein [Paracoccaceae bacterium]
MAWDLFALSERAMAMDDAAWARHASPASVWSRFTVVPLLSLAILSRAWLGAWALVPVALVLAWTWANPRLFPAPADRTSWAARGTGGERLYLNRATRPVPAHHARWIRALATLSALGLLPWAWGLWTMQPWPTLFGMALIMGGKAWCVDRMAWMYDDMMREKPDAEATRRPQRLVLMKAIRKS